MSRSASSVVQKASVILPAVLLGIAGYHYVPATATLSQLSWIPSLGINVSLRLDGLSMLFVGLIAGIGLLIQLYSLAYMKGKAQLGRFHGIMTLFMLSMLGLVLSDNILLLFVFWEMTTLTSYLLIGFNHEQEAARKKALQALLVTGSGGLALLAGLILLGDAAGSYELSQILAQGQALANHPIFTPALVLILLGCLTKSAQFPFHFWLPNAMAAPTPVSAYLHSATMVKAGIYLMARLSPVFADTSLWQVTLITLGTITALWTIVQALAQRDLKLMLAYSTTTVLGLLTVLLGIGTPLALTAMVTLILAHAFYKAALFMVVGTIEKATGTRQYDNLANLRGALPFTFAAAALAALSSAGLPPFMGFIAKEYLYKASLPLADSVLPAMVLTNILLVMLALVVVVRPFLGQATPATTPAKSVESYTMLWLPALLLSLLGIGLPVIGLGWLSNVLAIPYAQAVDPFHTPNSVKLWHGWTLPLALSAVTVLAALLGYRSYTLLADSLRRGLSHIINADAVYQFLLSSILRLASWQARLMQHGRASGYVLMFFAALLGLLSLALGQSAALPAVPISVDHFYYYEVILAGITVIAGLAAILARSRLYAIAALSVVGFCTTLVYVIYGAADVAMTQLLVETLVIVFLLAIIRHLPQFDAVPAHTSSRRGLHAAISLLIGGSIGLLLLMVLQAPLDLSISDYYAATSLPEAYGRNVVNVILVDFRAFDTFGEMSVVVFAALAALALLKRAPERKPSP